MDLRGRHGARRMTIFNRYHNSYRDLLPVGAEQKGVGVQRMHCTAPLVAQFGSAACAAGGLLPACDCFPRELGHSL